MSTSALSVLRLVVVVLVSVVYVVHSVSVPSFVGRWSGFTSSLPNPQLPDVPLLGNGHLGILLDSHVNDSTQTATVNVWLGSAAFWSCGTCDSQMAPGCCQMAAMGGIRFDVPLPTSTTSVQYLAEQRIANGELTATLLFSSSEAVTSSALLLAIRCHPDKNVALLSVQYMPADVAASNFTFNVSLWAEPATTAGAWPTPSSAGAQTASRILFHGRNAATQPLSPFPVWAAWALRIDGHQGAHAFFPTPALPTATLTLAANASIALLVAEAESLGQVVDPTASAISAAYAADVAELTAAADAFWLDFWSRSSISLPAAPWAEQVWYGAQYALACTSSTDAAIPTPGLYGVWTTSDNCNWHGDYTLDYNAESTFYGAFAANHPEQVQSYYDYVERWAEGPAIKFAQQKAAQLGIECSSSALFYACHLAPWGFQSYDDTVFMLWNGMFAALPFISAWEYTGDERAWNLLSGLNYFWQCVLIFNETDGLYHDTRGDQQHEGQPVPDPQIGLSLAYRTLSAQLDMANRLQRPLPSPEFAVMLAKLAPFDVDASGSVWTAYLDASVSDSDSFSLYPIWPAEAIPGPAGGVVAQNAARAYIDWINGRTVDIFSSAVLAGSGFVFADSVVQIGPAPSPKAFSPTEVLAGLSAHMNALFGANQLIYAPGGGVENIGVSHSVSSMLLGVRSDGSLQLFPFWPRAQSAAFTTALAKGGVLVSAAWDNSTNAVVSPVRFQLRFGSATVLRLWNPWPSASTSNSISSSTASTGSGNCAECNDLYQTVANVESSVLVSTSVSAVSVSVVCDGVSVAVSVSDNVLSWQLDSLAECWLSHNNQTKQAVA